MKPLTYFSIAVPITFLFIYGLVSSNIPVVVASGITGLIFSQWYTEYLRREPQP